jgi:succinoglycan biosynthesis transport protein ExoP
MANAQKLFDVSVRDLLYVVFRHKWKIVIVALLVIFGVALYTYVVPEKYTSEARILVKVGRESMAVDPTIAGPTMGMLVNRDAEVRSEVAILESRELIEEVVKGLGEQYFTMKPDEVGTGGIKGALRTVRRAVRGGVENVLYALDLKTRLDEHDAAVQHALDSLTVEVERNANTILVTYDAPGAEAAQKTLDGIITLYLQKHIDVYSSLAGPEFFEQRAAELRQALADAEAELEAFRTQNGIVDIASQKDAILERINSLMMDGRNLRAERDGAAARVAVLESAMKGRNRTHEAEVRITNASPVRDNLKQVLADLRRQEAEMASLYPDTHRPLVTLREQIGRMEGSINAEPESRYERVTAVDTVYQDLTVSLAQERAQLEAAKAAYESLEGSLEEAQEELARLAANETELARLQRQVDTAATEYTAYRDNVQRSRINEALETAQVSNLSVVQRPTRPVEPSYPNKPMNIGLGILLGIFAGLCLAFLLDYLDDSLNTTDRAERRLGVPVLAALSKEDYDACT